MCFSECHVNVTDWTHHTISEETAKTRPIGPFISYHVTLSNCNVNQETVEYVASP